uniref:Replication-associated protein n=1 Tax=Cressdnaviricota sp. TaxID=2748378 RepID=A0A6M3YPA4_9VIRU|nr:MAG: replication-associated protein [Cressdnaviricota sp.]
MVTKLMPTDVNCTEVKRMSRARGFCFTDFVLDRAFYDTFEWTYLLCGDERCPTTGRRHWQGYVHLPNGKTDTAMRKLMGGRHVEACRGTMEENINYCTKEGTNEIAIEEGVRPAQGHRSDLESIREMIEKNVGEVEIADMYFGKWCQYRRAFSDYRALKEPKRDWVTEIRYLWGESGSGKSRAAIEAGAVMVNWTGQFVLGYNGEDVVCFDDVDQHTFGSELGRQMLLQMTDRYAMSVNVKGAERNWKPRVIYFTSNTKPEDCYPFNVAAMKRRYTEVRQVGAAYEETAQKNCTEVPYG